MKQLDIFAIPQQDPAIALHYCQIAIDRDRLEAEAVAKLKNKSNTRSTYQDLNP